MLRYSEMPEKAKLTNKSSGGTIMLHENAHDMPSLPAGRFSKMPGTNDIYALESEFPSNGQQEIIQVSSDGGKSWNKLSNLSNDGSLIASDSGAFICSQKGSLVMGFANQGEMVREKDWDPDYDGDYGWKEPTYAARSLDKGKTWQDVIKLHDVWTGAVRDMKQLRSGRIIFTSMKMIFNPGRHTVLSYYSDDDGTSWKASNLIDLGGKGHHGGVSESTIVELKDGRVLMLIRTNWGQLWRSYSKDQGVTWHVYGPAGIDSSSAPAYIERLQSGRLVIVWCRHNPEGESGYKLRGGDNVWSATPTSNFRGEISIAFSEDEAENWSKPIVIARKEKGELSYPYLFEAEPGVLWITATRREEKLKMCLKEKDFIK
ncbi:MAG: sialidase family protein [Kiritimatiellia bacterium]|nr:glycoside hydrolase [Lentisphaerota bacterium]